MGIKFQSNGEKKYLLNQMNEKEGKITIDKFEGVIECYLEKA